MRTSTVAPPAMLIAYSRVRRQRICRCKRRLSTKPLSISKLLKHSAYKFRQPFSVARTRRSDEAARVPQSARWLGRRVADHGTRGAAGTDAAYRRAHAFAF